MTPRPNRERGYRLTCRRWDPILVQQPEQAVRAAKRAEEKRARKAAKRKDRRP